MIEGFIEPRFGVTGDRPCQGRYEIVAGIGGNPAQQVETSLLPFEITPAARIVSLQPGSVRHDDLVC